MNRQVLENLLQQGTDNALLRYTPGTLCLKEKDMGEAIQHLEKALELDPGHSASWKNYGKALAASGQLKVARAAYEKGIVNAETKGDIQAVKEMQVFLKRLSKTDSTDPM